MSEREAVTEDCRKLHNVDSIMCTPHQVYYLGHVASRGRREMHRGVQWGNLKERDCLEDLGVDGKAYVNGY